MADAALWAALAASLRPPHRAEAERFLLSDAGLPLVPRLLAALTSPGATTQSPDVRLAAATLLKTLLLDATRTTPAALPSLQGPLLAYLAFPSDLRPRLIVAAAAAALHRRGTWPSLLADLTPLLHQPASARVALNCLHESFGPLRDFACLAPAQRHRLLAETLGPAPGLPAALHCAAQGVVAVLQELGLRAQVPSAVPNGLCDEAEVWCLATSMLEVLNDLASLDSTSIVSANLSVYSTLLTCCLTDPLAAGRVAAFGLATRLFADGRELGIARAVEAAAWRRAAGAEEPEGEGGSEEATAALECLAAAYSKGVLPLPPDVYPMCCLLLSCLRLQPADYEAYTDEPVRYVQCHVEGNREGSKAEAALQLLKVVVVRSGPAAFLEAAGRAAGPLRIGGPPPSPPAELHAWACVFAAGSAVAPDCPALLDPALAVVSCPSPLPGPVVVAGLAYLGAARQHVGPAPTAALLDACAILLRHPDAAVRGAAARTVELFLSRRNQPNLELVAPRLPALLAGLCCEDHAARKCMVYTAACLHRVFLVVGDLGPLLPPCLAYLCHALGDSRAGGGVGLATFHLLAATSTVLKRHAAQAAAFEAQLFAALQPSTSSTDRALAGGALQLCGQLCAATADVAQYWRLALEVARGPLGGGRSHRLYLRHLLAAPPPPGLGRPTACRAVLEATATPRHRGAVLREFVFALTPLDLDACLPTLLSSLAPLVEQERDQALLVDLAASLAACIVKLYPDSVARGAETARPGLWPWCLEAVFLPGRLGMADAWDHKLHLVATTRLLTSSQAMAAAPLAPLRARLAEAAWAALQANDAADFSDEADEELGDGAEGDGEGTAGAELLLPGALLPEADPCEGVADGRTLFLRALQRLDPAFLAGLSPSLQQAVAQAD